MCIFHCCVKMCILKIRAELWSLGQESHVGWDRCGSVWACVGLCGPLQPCSSVQSCVGQYKPVEMYFVLFFFFLRDMGSDTKWFLYHNNDSNGVGSLLSFPSGFDTDGLSSAVWPGGETEALTRLERHLERKVLCRYVPCPHCQMNRRKWCQSCLHDIRHIQGALPTGCKTKHKHGKKTDRNGMVKTAARIWQLWSHRQSPLKCLFLPLIMSPVAWRCFCSSHLYQLTITGARARLYL